MEEENSEIPVQALIEMLMERIASLELEVAILKTRLSKKSPEPPTEEAPGSSGSYL